MDTGFETDPVEVREGQVYFTLDGSGRNITALCGADSYFQYEVQDETGCRHVVLVGGEPEQVGWAEFVWNADGEFIASSATYPDQEKPQWLLKGEAALGLDGE